MENKFYKRTILALEALKKGDILKYISILRSPSELAWELICQLFDDFGKYLESCRDRLDKIKSMALGLSSAEQSAALGDKLANYSLYLHSFHQLFQNSIKARQGNVLNEALIQVFKDNGLENYQTKKSQNEVLKELGVQTSSSHDLDVFSSIGDKYLIVQIRSRDDTGGTTAKASLVEFIRDIKQTLKFPKKYLAYLIYIWEPLKRQQRPSLINRITDSLGLKDAEKSVLSNGEALNYGTNIALTVVYGPDELFKTLKSVLSLNIDKMKYAKLINMLSQWDDLWLSYSIATLELENLLTKGNTNCSILEQLIKQEKIIIKGSDLINYRASSCKIAHILMEAWKQDSIVFSSPADQLNYIRDLVLLKMAHIAIKNIGITKTE